MLQRNVKNGIRATTQFSGTGAHEFGARQMEDALRIQTGDDSLPGSIIFWQAVDSFQPAIDLHRAAGHAFLNICRCSSLLL